jgi:hypothetical protein
MLVNMPLKKRYRRDSMTCGVFASKTIGIKEKSSLPLKAISALISAVP